VLGLELAEELEALRPFGMGNPQPTLLVPAARFQHVTGMGEGGEHARFTLVTAGGARSRGVAFGSAPKALEAASSGNHDIALRLERNRWNGMVEPRVILRALCPTKPGELRVLGEEGSFWERLERALEAPAYGAEAAAGRLASEPLDRRCEGFAGVAGDLFTSGAAVLVAVADVPRRRQGLEEIVAGLAPGGMAVASWATIAADPKLVRCADHLVALDPPPGGRADRLLRTGPRAHLAWGPAEAEFALLVYRAELHLRPALAEAFRALRALAGDSRPDAVEIALTGTGRYPRTPECCARLLAVLVELELVEVALERRTCRVREGIRADLTGSSAYRASGERLAAIERALGAELPQRARVRAA
jgi:single-stranded-DNA-specific exonuclease